jgi:hypothetical protein
VAESKRPERREDLTYRKISESGRAFQAPSNDQAEEKARFEVAETLRKIQTSVLNRRLQGESWSTILAWLLGLGGIC